MSKAKQQNDSLSTAQIKFFTDEEDVVSNKDLSSDKGFDIEGDTTEPEVLPESSFDSTQSDSSDNGDVTLSDSDTASSGKKSAVKNKSLIKNSVIIAFFVFIGTNLSRIIRNSFVASVLTAYDKTAEFFKKSFIYSFLTSTVSPGFQKFKKHVRRITTDAHIPKLFGKLTSAMLLIQIRIYGLVLLSFGISTLIIHFFVNYYFPIFIYDIYAPLTAGGMIAVSLFLVFSGKTLSQSVCQSQILSALLFKLLGIKRAALNENEEISLSASGALVLGLFLGLLTLIFPAYKVLLVILAIIYTFIVIKSPEAALISIFLLAPFAKSYLLIFATSVLAISYIFKVICGKRTLELEFMDLFVGIFIILIAFGGGITLGDASGVWVFAVYTGMYFITVSILRNKKWFRRSVNAILTVGIIASVYAIIARFLGDAFKLNLITSPESDTGPINATAISSLSVLSYFVLIALFFLIASFFMSPSSKNRFFLLITTLASAVFLFSTLTRGAWVAAVFSIILFLILWKSRSAVVMVILALFIPFLPIFNIHSVENFFASLIPDAQRNAIWNTAIRMFPDFGIGGIGLGNDAFSTIYPSYIIGNTDTVSHSGSLILQILLSLGVIGLIVFIAIIFFILQSSFSYGRNCAEKSHYNRIICYAGMCAIIASAIWGLNEFIWYNPRIMLMFWLVAGVTVSSRRSDLSLDIKESEIDYFGDTYFD